MKLHYLIVFTTSLIITSSVLGQTPKKQKQGDKNFEKYSYSKAIEKYESFEPKTIEIKRKLAESYSKMGNTIKSEEYYAEIAKSSEKTPSDLFEYSSILSKNGKYEESNVLMEAYHEFVDTDGRAIARAKAPELYKKLQKDQGRFTIKNLSANTTAEDFGASYYKDKVVFASSREGVSSVKRTWNWNGLPYLDTYIATVDSTNDLSEITEFHKKINNKYHEGPVAFNKAGDYMVFTRNNYKGKSKEGIVKLQLYCSKQEDDKWSKEEAVPFNSNEYSVGHASLSADGKTMYFASDMPGGKGGVDLYKSEMQADGTWGTPNNLGDKINTEGNEMFPFIHSEGELLFFSSDGHVGLGGLDVFITQLKGESFGKVENVGAPVNSSKDDFSLILDEAKKRGYFSSNRLEGKGDDDIYSYELLKPFSFGKIIKGVAKDKKGNILSGTDITLYDDQNQILTTVTTTEEGTYSFTVEPDKDFRLGGTKEKYFDGENTASTKTDAEEVIADVILEKDPGLSLYAIVTDKKTGEALEGVTLNIIDNITGEETTYATPSTGDYRRPLADKKLNDRGSYNFTLQKEGYFTKTVTYNTEFNREGQYDVHTALDLSLDPEVKDLSELIEINPINFDLNKYKIRPDAAIELDKIIEIMNKYPNMVVELGSHTDSRGSDSYNKKLSDRRAKASAAYIKKHITDPKRIYGKGYGESRVINRCVNGVKCSDEEHEENRRTEFKVISTGNDAVKVKNNSSDSF